MTSAALPGTPAARNRRRKRSDRSLTGAGLRATALIAGLGLLLIACSDPPPPAPEPTGDDLERAWRVAVGSDPLDQTIAQIYARAINSHEEPTVVVEEDRTAVELATALAEESAQSQQDTAEPEADEEPEVDAEESVDERYEIVLARTMPLAQSLDPEGYAELTAPDDQEDDDAQDDDDDNSGQGPAADSVAPAAEPEELTTLIEDQLSGAELLAPTSAVLSRGLHITSITAEQHEVDGEDDTDLDEFAQDCAELTIGVTADLPEAGPLLEGLYDCTPEEVRAGEEDELVEMLITAGIDAAVLTGSHPGVAENALITLQDARRAFPRDQYAPIVSSRVAQEMPGVVGDISQSLDDEALLTLRRLIYGEDGLAPEDAAVYWLVEEGFLAEPDHWG